MSIFLAGLAIGLVIGANIGLVTAALLRSAKDADRPRAQEGDGAQDQEPHGEVVVIHH
jgi:hypothetical protein